MTLPADHRKMGILDRYDLISPAELEFIPEVKQKTFHAKENNCIFMHVNISRMQEKYLRNLGLNLKGDSSIPGAALLSEIPSDSQSKLSSFLHA